MKQPSYRIYPSLLDKFDKYLRADEEVEKASGTLIMKPESINALRKKSKRA